jgi:hypothetical protein
VPDDYTGEKATFLFNIPHPKIPPPFYTTNPLPSNPAVHGHFLVSEYLPTSRKAKSDGLIGAAITLIRTYPGFGFGIGIYLTFTVLGAYRINAFIILTYACILCISFLYN